MAADPTYKQEVEFITSIQRSVLNIAPEHEGLPYGQKRELKQLYKQSSGLCYDRSRVIEKILNYSGLKTRHVAIYSTKNTGSAIRSLLSTEASSHAVTEVLTRNGWLVVYSNEPFLSIDDNGQPVSIREIQQRAGKSGSSIRWNKDPQHGFYREPFTYLYGFYSRHGQFFPPYNFVPGINYREFVANVL